MDYFNNLDTSPLGVGVLFAWAMFWKGISLWRASKGSQKNWFIALLLINSLGILDLVYLFRFAKDKLTAEELKSWIKFK